MKTVDEIIQILKPKQILTKGLNYLQIIDNNDNLKEYKFDHRKSLWIEFKTEGTSDNPKEIFIQYV